MLRIQSTSNIVGPLSDLVALLANRALHIPTDKNSENSKNAISEPKQKREAMKRYARKRGMVTASIFKLRPYGARHKLKS